MHAASARRSLEFGLRRDLERDPGTHPMDRDRSTRGPEDLELVRRARAGRADAVETFVLRMRCIPRFLAARNRGLGRPLTPEELKDASQQVFALVWSRIDSFRGEASLETWVYSFCRLTVTALQRSNRRAAAVAAEPVREPAAPEPAREPGAELDDELLHDALERIEPDSACVIRLKQFDDLTLEEIAERLAVPISTVKSRYYRGLASLRERLRALGPEGAS